MSLFKLNIKKKEIEGFDMSNPEGWIMLQKPEIQNFTKFVHYHFESNPVIEEEEHDEEGNITGTKTIELSSRFTKYKGYIKDGNFIIEHSRNYRRTLDGLKADIVHDIEDMVAEGYSKDYNQYNSDNTAKEPTYHTGNPGSSTSGKFSPQIMSALFNNKQGVGISNP